MLRILQFHWLFQPIMWISQTINRYDWFSASFMAFWKKLNDPVFVSGIFGSWNKCNDLSVVSVCYIFPNYWLFSLPFIVFFFFNFSDISRFCRNLTVHLHTHVIQVYELSLFHFFFLHNDLSFHWCLHGWLFRLYPLIACLKRECKTRCKH